MEQQALPYTSWVNVNCYIHFGIQCAIILPYDPAILLPGIYIPSRIHAHLQPTDTNIFRPALFVIALHWEQSTHRVAEWINIFWHIHTTEYHTATKMKEQPHKTRMNLANTKEHMACDLCSKSAQTVMFRGTQVVKGKRKKEMRRVVTCRWERRTDGQKKLQWDCCIPVMSYFLTSEWIII